MNDLLARGSEWLEGQRSAHLTRDVTYSRVSGSVDVKATVGRRVFRFQNEFGVEQRIEVREYLILAADLQDLSPSPVTPLAGDRISEPSDDGDRVYEVMSPNPLEPPWRWSDRSNRTFRIHTKKVGGPL